MTPPEWQGVITAFIAGPAGVWLFKWITERRAAKEAKELKHQSDTAGERIAQYGIVPELLRRIETLETNYESLHKTTAAQIDRMEREAIRMYGHLVQIHADYLRLMVHADSADNLLKFYRPEWASHNLPRHDYIPDFKDPKLVAK